MRSLLPLGLVAITLVLAASAQAGTPEEPELTDAAGDCAFAPGNEYADVVAAWISDETATHFNVNVAIAKWLEPAAAMAGYTVQFEHQGKQFGIAAFYTGGGQWYYSNAYIGEESASDFSDAEGSFTPGEPATITVAFDKSHFPHDDPMDHVLKSFWAGTADFKASGPLFLVPAQLPTYPPPVACDEGTSDATYMFQVGGHSMESMGEENETAEQDGMDMNTTTEDTTAAEGVEPVDTAATNEKDTPLPALAAIGGALVAAGLAARRRA